MIRAAALAVVALTAVPAAAALAQEEPVRLTVTVLDQQSGAPVRNARLELAGVARPVTTNGSGVARLDRVPAGSRILTVTRLGYSDGRVAVDLPAGGEVEQTVRLLPSSVAVEGVTASGERREQALEDRGFYARQRTQHGAYMTADEIDRIRPSRSIDLFRRVRGFMVTYDRRGNPFLMTSRGGVGLATVCTSIVVYLDGIPATSRMVAPAEALDMVPPEQLAAIEAYAGASSIPAEYNPTGSACGVVLLWTRSR